MSPLNNKNVVFKKRNLLYLALAVSFVLAYIAVSPSIQTSYALDSSFSDGITVDSTLDTPDSSIDGVCNDGSGNCTLRAAIEEANSNLGADTIKFNIPGFGPHTITPMSVYPVITDSLVIDGRTQPGSVCGPTSRSLMINIDSDGFGNLTSSSILMFNGAPNSGLYGVTMVGARTSDPSMYGASSVIFSFSDNSKISCNNFGTNTTATALSSHPGGAVGGVIDTDGFVFGGTTPEDRNIIGGVSGDAIYEIDSGTRNAKFIGNHVGVDFTGLVALPIQATAGVGVNDLGGDSASPAFNIQIGGDDPAERNVFSSMPISSSAVYVSGIYAGIHDVEVVGNYIGVNANREFYPEFAVNRGIAAVSLDLFGNSPVTSNSIFRNNYIYSNDGPAVMISYFGQAVLKNITIIDNIMYSKNGTNIDLCEITSFPVDLSNINESGPTDNDVLDPDSGANDYINKPEITGISQNGDQITFTYNLDTIGSPSGQYYLQFYMSDAPDSFGYVQGSEIVGSTVVSASGPLTGATVTFTLPSSNDVTSKVFSSTNTVVDNSLPFGYGSTSEFGGVVLGYTTSYTPPFVGDPAPPNTGYRPMDSYTPAILLIVTAVSVGEVAGYALERKR